MKKVWKGIIKLVLGGLTIKLISAALPGDTSIKSNSYTNYQNDIPPKDTSLSRQNLKLPKDSVFYEKTALDGTTYVFYPKSALSGDLQ